jgi:hypothetical protein
MRRRSDEGMILKEILIALEIDQGGSVLFGKKLNRKMEKRIRQCLFGAEIGNFRGKVTEELGNNQFKSDQ